MDFNCTGCPDAPNVELKTGAGWTIEARDPGNPGGIGDIGTISSPHPANFAVSIGPDLVTPGARNVGAIILDPQGVGSNGNESNLDGTITGTVGGDVFVQISDTGQGGEGSLLVFGDVEGTIGIPIIVAVQILGRTLGAIRIGEIGKLGALTIGTTGPCTANPVVAAPLEIGLVREGGVVAIFGGVGADVRVRDGFEIQTVFEVAGTVGDVNIDLGPFQTGGGFVSFVEFGEGTPPQDPCSFRGSLTLSSGVNADTTVFVHGPLESGALIDLKNKPVAERLRLFDGGGGTIVNGGAVVGTGVVTLAEGASNTYSGSATFAGVSSGGEVKTTDGADLAGTLIISGAMAGSIHVDDNLSGDIVIGADLSGAIGITGHQLGDVDIAGDTTPSSQINLRRYLRGGRMIVDGLMDGPISIGQGTSVLSQINLFGGVGPSGQVVINADGGTSTPTGTSGSGRRSHCRHCRRSTSTGAFRSMTTGRRLRVSGTSVATLPSSGAMISETPSRYARRE